MKTTYTTTWGSDEIVIAADFAEASAQIEGLGDRQVADFGHSPRKAMKAALMECAVAEGISNDDGTDELIEESLSKMTASE